MLGLEKFIARNFISFYKDEEKYKLLNQKVRNNKILDEEYKEFENKDELEQYIKDIENPQKYTITFLANENLGMVPSCEKAEYKKRDIELDNIKMICVNNKYSFYAAIYDIVELEKMFKFEVDLIYSAYVLIDFKASKKNNLYMLLTKEFYALLIYEDSMPKYADILTLVDSYESDDNIEELDMDIIEDLGDEIVEESVEDLDEEDLENKSNTVEAELINFLKDSIKEHYKTSDNFVEKIIIFSTIQTQDNFAKLIEDEIFIETQVEEFNILKTLIELGKIDV